jgi:hypothetical protein
MDMQGRTLVMIPGEELAALKGTLEKVLAEIKNLQLPKQSPTKESFITAKEFMAAVRIGRTKFDQLVAARKIQTIKKRRKIYVPVTEVNRYFTDPNIL